MERTSPTKKLLNQAVAWAIAAGLLLASGAASAGPKRCSAARGNKANVTDRACKRGDGGDAESNKPAEEKGVRRVRSGPHIEVVARDLGFHPRTLRRRLTGEGTSFRALVDQILRARARRLLADPSLHLADVAQRLGFAEPASFIHAHRRWTGRTPRGRR